MRRHQAASDPVAVPAAADVPLLATQAAIWYAQALDPDSPVYNTGDAVEITGPLDAGLFESALRRTVDEADALSAVVLAENTGAENSGAEYTGAENSGAEDADPSPRQRLTPGRPWTLHHLDLRAEADPEAAAETWMRADLARPVDLTEGPLFTQALIRLAEDRHWWYQRVHHLAVDAYALTLLTGRVAELYT
ncbi:condensation domain-containing protein, partial [Streptomyces sp. NRRL S-495]|uniref:condensation domain-containing protein n=1 Tax=Streptomyces sp. NRRL S-495 TaxID=1609133 RepID=UPI0005F972E4